MAETQPGIDESSEPLLEEPGTERRLFTQSFDLAVQTVPKGSSEQQATPRTPRAGPSPNLNYRR